VHVACCSGITAANKNNMQKSNKHCTFLVDFLYSVYNIIQQRDKKWGQIFFDNFLLTNSKIEKILIRINFIK